MRDSPAHNPSLRSELGLITRQLLAPDSDNSTLRSAVTALHVLLADVSGLTEASTDERDRLDIALESGVAISPLDAARSILDYRRTVKFLRGLEHCVSKARRRFPNGNLKILYAGCGPFAPFAVMMSTLLSPAEVQFTLLDVNPLALARCRRLFAALGLGHYVSKYIEADAGTFQTPAGDEFHIILVEAMQNALDTEPQVNITLNLAPQLAAGGFFIPERIQIVCHLTDPQAEVTVFSRAPVADVMDQSKQPRFLLDSVFELSAASALDLNQKPGGKQRAFDPVVVEIPESQQRLHAILTTEVTVSDSIVLREGESGLTQSKLLRDLAPLEPGTRIEFRYEIGPEPGLRYRIL
jgi:hypothetical protein